MPKALLISTKPTARPLVGCCPADDLDLIRDHVSKAWPDSLRVVEIDEEGLVMMLRQAKTSAAAATRLTDELLALFDTPTAAEGMNGDPKRRRAAYCLRPTCDCGSCSLKAGSFDCQGEAY